jgi:hypothetical protein
MPADRTRYRVVKTLSPTDRGAIGLAQHYGDALVCVRHRTDAKGKVRHTTVELLIQSTPIQPRTTQMVLVKVPSHQQPLHAVIQAAGGHWDSKRHLWRLPSRVASILNLRRHIVHHCR